VSSIRSFPERNVDGKIFRTEVCNVLEKLDTLSYLNANTFHYGKYKYPKKYLNSLKYK